MAEFIEMIHSSNIPNGENQITFDQDLVFDRKAYRKFILHIAGALPHCNFMWVHIRGSNQAYKITTNKELTYVISYVYNALIRDPLVTTIKVPVMPPLMVELQPPSNQIKLTAV